MKRKRFHDTFDHIVTSLSRSKRRPVQWTRVCQRIQSVSALVTLSDIEWVYDTVRDHCTDEQVRTLMCDLSKRATHLDSPSCPVSSLLRGIFAMKSLHSRHLCFFRLTQLPKDGKLPIWAYPTFAYWEEAKDAPDMIGATFFRDLARCLRVVAHELNVYAFLTGIAADIPTAIDMMHGWKETNYYVNDSSSRTETMLHVIAGWHRCRSWPSPLHKEAAYMLLSRMCCILKPVHYPNIELLLPIIINANIRITVHTPDAAFESKVKMRLDANPKRIRDGWTSVLHKCFREHTVMFTRGVVLHHVLLFLCDPKRKLYDTLSYLVDIV